MKVELTENRLFIAIAVVVVVFIGVVYVQNISTEIADNVGDIPETTLVSTLPQSSIRPTTSIEPVEEVTHELIIDDVILGVPEVSTSTVEKTTTTVNPYFAKFMDKGYHQAYIHVIYQCPSCVPAIARVLQDESGIIAKSMAYRQKISWVIYDPEKVNAKRIVTLIGASGEATLLNDTLI